MWSLFKKKLEERKIAKEEIKKVASLMDKYAEELVSLNPSNIKADRIKVEINRLRGIYNTRFLRLLEDQIIILWVVISILFLGLTFSFFTKPKFEIGITLSLTIGFSIAISALLIIIVRHIITKEDSEAKRKRDEAEADYFKHLIKKGKI